MNFFEFRCHFFNGLIDKMNPPIIGDLDGNIEPCYNLLINKPCCTDGCIIWEYSRLHPLCKVLNGYDNILTSMHVAYLQWPHKSRPHLSNNSCG